jgi:DNA-binding NarL/FixJ family response regulator
MVPEQLLHDLANTPTVDEQDIPETRAAWRHEGEITEAELEVVMHLSHGLTQKMVAETLGKSEQTVKDQVKSARAALNAKTRIHLVAIALRQGLID